MMLRHFRILVGLAAVLTASVFAGSNLQTPPPAQTLPQHPPAPGDGKNMVVQLCDGETNLTVEGVAPGERLSPQQAQQVSNKLMSMWLEKQPASVAAAWERGIATAKQPPAAASSQAAQSGEAQQPNPFSPRDYSMWDQELQREVALGDKIFHDDKLIGSTNGVACAMCHPNGANTHPETYPKFQIQLKRVALLRDMINWCIENPSRGPRLDADDPKMRALEAYILSQRRGVQIEPGKH